MPQYHSFFTTAARLKVQPKNVFSQLFSRSISEVDLPELRDFMVALNASNFEEQKEAQLILLLKAFIRLAESVPGMPAIIENNTAELYQSGSVNEKKSIIEKLKQVQGRVWDFSRVCLLKIILMLADEQMETARQIKYIKEYINEFRLSVLTSFGKDVTRLKFIIISAEHPDGLSLRFSPNDYSPLEIVQAVLYYFKTNYLLDDQQLASLIAMAPPTGYTYFLACLNELTMFDRTFDSSLVEKYGFKPNYDGRIKLMFNESKRLKSLTAIHKLNLAYLNQKINTQKVAAVSYLHHPFTPSKKPSLLQDDFLSGFFLPGGFTSDSVSIGYQSLAEQGYVSLPTQLTMDFSLSSAQVIFFVWIQKNYIHLILLSAVMGGILSGVAATLAIFLWPTVTALIGVAASGAGMIAVIIILTSLIGGLLAMILAASILDPLMKFDGVNELDPQPFPQNERLISIRSIINDQRFPSMPAELKKLIALTDKANIINIILWLDQDCGIEKQGFTRISLEQTLLEELEDILAEQLKLITTDSKKEMIFKHYNERLLTNKGCASAFSNPILAVLEKNSSLNQALLDDFKRHIVEQAENHESDLTSGESTPSAKF